MSGAGAPTSRPYDAGGLKVAVVAASWHTQVMDGLVAGAERALAAYDVTGAAVLRVPGTFALPAVAAALAREGYDAVVALGVVIRGGTPHFDYVAGEASNGCAAVARQYGIPVANGVLTTETWDQAVERAGGKLGNKGAEAALGAVETANVLKEL